MTIGPGLVVVIGVRKQGQEAGTLDGGVQLALIVCLGTSQAGRNDLAVFLDEIAQSVEIFVIALVNIGRTEEHTSELQSLMRTSYAVFCSKKKKNTIQ